MKDKMKLLIAIPCYDTAEAEFLKCFSDLIVRLAKDGYNFEVKVISGTLVYLAREELAHYAVRNGFSHVLWLDSDMVFEPDILDRMLAHGKPFVSAAFRSRHGKYYCCFSKDIVSCQLLDEMPTEPFWAEACGFAGALIETRILQAVRHRYGTCFDANIKLGEDFEFCRKALTVGHRVYVDPNIKMGHVGRYTIWPDNIDLLREYEKRER